MKAVWVIALSIFIVHVCADNKRVIVEQSLQPGVWEYRGTIMLGSSANFFSSRTEEEAEISQDSLSESQVEHFRVITI
jgi:hypothetical protein